MAIRIEHVRQISQIQELIAIDQDSQHLQLLSIFQYILGGIMGLFGCIPFIHLGIGIAMVNGMMDGGGNAPPPEMGWFFIIIAVIIIAQMWATAIAAVITGRKLAARRGYTFCLVVAGIECLFMPFGTVLGVFTIIVLVRPSVKEMFDVSL